MPTPPTIVGWSSNNRVPGFYGETVYGAGPISAASVPLTLLLVGTKLTAGTAVVNQDIDTVLSVDDADRLYGAGSELARMCYAAIKVPSVTIKAAAVPEAAGSASATLTVTIAGTWTAGGTLAYRVNGERMSVQVGAFDAAATVAANIAAQLNQDGRRPYVAAAVGPVVTITIKSKGARGNQYILFQELGLAPPGLTSTIAGGTPVTGGGVPFWTGTGTESVATLLALIAGQTYDRIVTAQNDATNLQLWFNQLNSQAGPSSNITQHFIAATNGAMPTSLATSTMNSQRQQLVWYLNGESYPAQWAAYMGAMRTVTEQGDPAAAYDDMPFPSDVCAPQSQRGDWPSNATLMAAINNGITCIYTSGTGQQALLCRSVTTHTLNGTTSDYRTLDTSDAYVPDFVRKAVGLFWATGFKVSNPRVANDAADGKPAPSGVATPSVWNSSVEAMLRDFERGILTTGSAPGQPTVAPIIINVDTNKPNTVFDPARKCLVGVIPVVPAPAQHQIGISVRQLAA